MSCVKTRRLFVALWPSQDDRSAVSTALGTLPLPAGARRVPEQEWHITLAFLSVVPESLRSSIEQLLTQFPVQPERLVLDSFEWWPESRVGVWAATRTPPTLAAAHACLCRQLEDLGLRIETRDWRPHLTLARALDASCVTPSPQPLQWPIRSIALVESHAAVGSGRYTPLMAHELI